MTKTLAATYRQSLLDSTAPNLSSVNLKIVALDATYVYSAAHNALDDIGGGSIVATTGNLASKTITNGVLDFADVSLGSPVAGDTITQLWLYHDTGVASTSVLIAYTNEDSSAAAISIATDGGDITLILNASGFFRA